MNDFLRSGIYSLTAGAFGRSNYYIILLQKKDETCIIYVFDDKQQPHAFDFNHELGCSLQ